MNKFEQFLTKRSQCCVVCHRKLKKNRTKLLLVLFIFLTKNYRILIFYYENEIGCINHVIIYPSGINLLDLWGIKLVDEAFAGPINWMQSPYTSLFSRINADIILFFSRKYLQFSRKLFSNKGFKWAENCWRGEEFKFFLSISRGWGNSKDLERISEHLTKCLNWALKANYLVENQFN